MSSTPSPSRASDTSRHSSALTSDRRSPPMNSKPAITASSRPRRCAVVGDSTPRPSVRGRAAVARIAAMVLTRGLTDGSARAEGDVGAEGRVGFRGFVGAAVPVYQRLIEERCAKVDHWQNSPRSHQRAGSIWSRRVKWCRASGAAGVRARSPGSSTVPAISPRGTNPVSFMRHRLFSHAFQAKSQRLERDASSSSRASTPSCCRVLPSSTARCFKRRDNAWSM